MEIPTGIFFLVFGVIFGLMSLGTHQEQNHSAYNRPAHQAIEFFSLGRNETFGVFGAGAVAILLTVFGMACLIGLIDLPPRAA